MTREAIRKHFNLILAYKNGAQIQIYSSDSCIWQTVDNPSFSLQYSYRIKPLETFKRGEKVKAVINSQEIDATYIVEDESHYYVIPEKLPLLADLGNNPTLELKRVKHIKKISSVHTTKRVKRYPKRVSIYKYLNRDGRVIAVLKTTLRTNGQTNTELYSMQQYTNIKIKELNKYTCDEISSSMFIYYKNLFVRCNG